MDWFIILRLNLCSINRCWLVYWLVNRLLWYIIVLRVDWLLWDLLTIIIILMLIEIRRLSLIRTHWCRYIAIKSIEHRSFLIIQCFLLQFLSELFFTNMIFIWQFYFCFYPFINFSQLLNLILKWRRLSSLQRLWRSLSLRNSPFSSSTH